MQVLEPFAALQRPRLKRSALALRFKSAAFAIGAVAYVFRCYHTGAAIFQPNAAATITGLRLSLTPLHRLPPNSMLLLPHEHPQQAPNDLLCPREYAQDFPLLLLTPCSPANLSSNTRTRPTRISPPPDGNTPNGCARPSSRGESRSPKRKRRGARKQRTASWL